jgi:hypothetical protein
LASASALAAQPVMLHSAVNVLKRVSTVTSRVVAASKPSAAALILLLSRSAPSTPFAPTSASRMHASSHGGMTTRPATSRNAVRTTSAGSNVCVRVC